MKRLEAKPGSTATPSNPRSPFLHSFAVRSSAGVLSSVPAAVRTRRVPVFDAMSIRPSGVNASAIGEATLATGSSEKPGGSVTAWAPATDPASAASVAIAASMQRRRISAGQLRGASG